MNRNNPLGGKAKGLNELRSKGFNVPDFFVIPHSTFARDSSENPTQLSDDQKEWITHQMEEKNWTYRDVVARSSANVEDGSDQSYAGQFKSFLNHKNQEEFFQNVLNVYLSASGEVAMAYAEITSIQMNVVIQKRIDAQISGVVLTQNPLYSEEFTVHAVEGLAEELVGGTADPMEYGMLRKDGSTYYGNEDSEESTKLSEHWQREIFDQGLRAEKLWGVPLDMEYCIENETLYWVQARPITAEIQESITLDNSNIQESYCGVTTPLTFSFALRAYHNVYTQTMRSLGLSESKISSVERITKELLYLHRGRIYYHINHWYEGLLLLPSFSRNKEDMERMMGVEEPIDFVDPESPTLLSKLSELPSTLTNLIRLLKAFKNLDKNVAAFQKNMESLVSEFYAVDLSKASWKELVALWEMLNQKGLNRWSTPIVNDFYVMMKNGSAQRKLDASGIQKTSTELTAGKEELATVLPMIELWKLAREAHDDKAVKAVVMGEKPSLEQLAKASPDFAEKAKNYIHLYGDRTVGELKLETVTMRENPNLFFEYLINLMIVPELPNTETQPLIDLPKKTQKALSKLSRGIARREEMRLSRTRLFGMYRRLFTAMGHQAVEKGCLENARDVFYLDESLLLAGPNKEWLAKVKETQKQFATYENPVPKSRVVTGLRPQWEEVDMNGPMMGEGCVTGEVSGEIMVISEPKNGLDVRDKIVCAVRTDPGWAALFPACKAVLIEKGSSLSHSVILLREMGIPTIINIPSISQKLKSGDHVTVNGSSGIITRHENQ